MWEQRGEEERGGLGLIFDQSRVQGQAVAKIPLVPTLVTPMSWGSFL